MARLSSTFLSICLAGSALCCATGCGPGGELDEGQPAGALAGKGDTRGGLVQGAASAAAGAVAVGDAAAGDPAAPKLQNPHQNRPYYYKVQPHSHSDASDGNNAPDAVERAYRDKGYTFVHLTDHNQLSPDPGVPGVLHVPSGEDGYSWRHHIIALGINLDKVAWYHDNVDPDRDADQDGLDDRGTRDCDGIQGRIDYITQVQGSLAVLAHPKASHDWLGGEGFTLSELKQRRSYTGIEIFNAGGLWATDWWDEVLSLGKKVWGFGSDDCHQVLQNNKSFNRTWIVVNSENGPASAYLGSAAQQDALRQDELQNIADGNFYTVVRSPQYPGDSPSDGSSDLGPKLEISVLADVVHVKTDRTCQAIRFIGSQGTLLQQRTNLVQDNYRVNTATEKYVRIEVEQLRDDGQRYIAFSQPLFVIQPPRPPECADGAHRVSACRLGCCDWGLREDLCVAGRWRNGPCRPDGPLP